MIHSFIQACNIYNKIFHSKKIVVNIADFPGMLPHVSIVPVDFGNHPSCGLVGFAQGIELVGTLIAWRWVFHWRALSR